MALFAQVKSISPDRTSLIVEFADGHRETVSKLLGYDPTLQEKVLLVGLETGGYVALDAVYDS